LLADGLSMAVSNYESIKAHNEFVAAVRREEERHIKNVPEGEREEIRQIFARKGFAGAALEHIVATITADRRLWLDTMLAEEHGLRSEHAIGSLKSLFFGRPAIRSGLTTLLTGGSAAVLAYVVGNLLRSALGV